jgi:hypothetical protein
MTGFRSIIGALLKKKLFDVLRMGKTARLRIEMGQLTGLAWVFWPIFSSKLHWFLVFEESS